MKSSDPQLQGKRNNQRPQTQRPADTQDDWWKYGVIYQVNVRSFFDANNDGVGDIKGLTAKLDYFVELGVAAIALTPVFTSPMSDFGFDVSDYYSLDPAFGDLDDFDALIREANKRGLRVLLDIVISHTSVQHPWFLESKQDRNNPKADWYVWADAQADGTVPNNWQTTFGHPAWSWSSTRGQYYLHNATSRQADLNFHNSEVIAEVLNILQFWLERGVAGFRLDCPNLYTHDKKLRNNPARRNMAAIPEEALINPFEYQLQIYNQNRPETLPTLARIRRLCDRYEAALLGSVTSSATFEMLNIYSGSQEGLQMANIYEALPSVCNLPGLVDVVRTFEENCDQVWPYWMLNNHDVARLVSRWEGDHDAPRLAAIVLALHLSLRGTPVLFQGDELGLEEAYIPFDNLCDPYGKLSWPQYMGRDGCRTPLPWDDNLPQAGFSTHKPWLPIDPRHLSHAINVQQKDPESVLRRVQRFIQWREEQPEILLGSMSIIHADASVLLLLRKHKGGRLLAAFNVSYEPAEIELNLPQPPEVLNGHGFAGELRDNRIYLPPYEAFFGRLP
ncbi:alpha-glucosidase family protein [Hahella sp. CR1]|uniref:alpha-glucosidase n=1 Tax=Hahella sp. CR1 TaxID=2992807 RepID=UPI002442F44D|nr:alpha glucosidase [Hahella sp. CR1]MDG9666303.1 alpha-glucosidase family protein [Hahella sp. CR1]